jgi:hypothetical protein
MKALYYDRKKERNENKSDEIFKEIQGARKKNHQSVEAKKKSVRRM